MTEKITVLRVQARRNGYRRAGLQFGEMGASIPLSALTSHQVKELRTDRMLATSTIDVIAISETEHDDLRRKEAIANAYIGALPVESEWAARPAEYLEFLQSQLRVQTERADELRAKLDTVPPVATPASKPAHNASTSKTTPTVHR